MKNSVLIADNEELNLIILDNILNPFYTVYKAFNGFFTIKTATNNLPDLILMNIDMPDMVGFDVLKILKTQHSTRNIPVIFITDIDSVEYEEKGLALEAADIIYKPLRSKIIRSRVRNQIQIVNQFRELTELHKDLEDAVKLAETANRAKSAFLAKMSHEIRTPLNAVLGISEIQLQNDSLNDETKEAFTHIYNSGDLLLGIINDILDMSKIETGKLELSLARYDLCSLINDTVNLNIVRYRDKPIKFLLDVQEDIPSYLTGDEVRIKQILNNVLSNAFKYTKKGEIELIVKTEKINGVVILVFIVRDTGQGMKKEQLDKLFDEYVRFNLDANKMIEGVGLGMSITKSLVNLMKGEIFVDSEEGKGTVFTIRLPQAEAETDGNEEVKKTCRFKAQTRQPLHIVNKKYNKKILIVDDNETNIFVEQRMLSLYGLQIDTAMSGMESIEKVKNNKYDLVFMDHMMPEMDGIEALKEIRKLGGECEKMPVIALSANAVSGMKENFLNNGFNGFISKPILLKEMDKILNQFLPERPVMQHLAENNNHRQEYETFLLDLKKMKEIDADSGLEQLLGNAENYYNTLEMFHKKIITECANMTIYLNKNELKSFSISIHAMKTMLAIVGAKALSLEAYEMEKLSYDKKIEECRENFWLFKEKLFELQKTLAGVFGKMQSGVKTAD